MSLACRSLSHLMTTPSLSQQKQRLFDHCLSLVDQRIDSAKQAMEAAEEAMQEETKSSVGDKYETGRAMMQIEREKYKLQLIKAMQLRRELQSAKAAPMETAAIGHLIETNSGSYFLSVGLGKVSVENKLYYVVSPSSPIGRQLIGRKVGESIQLNGRSIQLTAIG
ncbi:MAG: 3-oxoacyl-ACP synthase [Bacteroidota bacterium]